ncbi:MAG: NAD(+)/NADH kinase [Halobacteriales archaeon]
MVDATIGLIVNPAAGRDSRRLVGSAVVSDTYAKRLATRSFLEGVNAVSDPVTVSVMPDHAGIGEDAVTAASGVDTRVLDMPVQARREDTRTAASAFREDADCIVVFGGDGTTRDVALECGEVPILPISTGTNNVVPDCVDGTAAGIAGALIATGAVSPDTVTDHHGMVAGSIEGSTTSRSIRGLATLGIVDTRFTGTRAILRGTDFLGGVVSRSSPRDSGLSGIVGSIAPSNPTDPGGMAVTLGDPEETANSVSAMTVPGSIERIGIESVSRLDTDETAEFRIEEGVVSVDGERHVEVSDATVTFRPTTAGTRIVDVEAVFERAADEGLLVH